MLLIIIITIITPFLLCLLLKHFLLEGSTSRSSNPSMHGGYVANCSLYSSVICHAYRPDICIACPAFLFAKKRDKAFFCNLYSASPSQSWELLSCRMVRSGKRGWIARANCKTLCTAKAVIAESIQYSRKNDVSGRHCLDVHCTYVCTVVHLCKILHYGTVFSVLYTYLCC